ARRQVAGLGAAQDRARRAIEGITACASVAVGNRRRALGGLASASPRVRYDRPRCSATGSRWSYRLHTGWRWRLHPRETESQVRFDIIERLRLPSQQIMTDSPKPFGGATPT